ncbi:MAG: sulfotransferase domain-containing protein [Caldilineaceae bacterium]
MTDQLPTVTHIYQNHTLDSTRWARYQPRTGDIVITTSIKSGTTWMQEIVRQLICLGQTASPLLQMGLWDVSLWLDARWFPLDEVIGKLDAQHHRRFMKTHLALDGLPFFPQVSYIVVGRDARDVAMSLWNHWSGFTQESADFFNNAPGWVGDPCPPPQNIHEFWRDWMTRGWFPWEGEGYPFYGNLHHTQSWWAYRHLPNILFVHYNDLLHDLAGEIERIAKFLQIPLTDEGVAALLPALTLGRMRDNAERLEPAMKMLWREGAKTFFFKGNNGRWKDAFSAEELALYDETAAKVLTPDCRAWLEQGRLNQQHDEE